MKNSNILVNHEKILKRKKKKLDKTFKNVETTQEKYLKTHKKPSMMKVRKRLRLR